MEPRNRQMPISTSAARERYSDTFVGSGFAHHSPVDEVTYLALSIGNKRLPGYFSRAYSMNRSLASSGKET